MNIIWKGVISMNFVNNWKKPKIRTSKMKKRFLKRIKGSALREIKRKKLMDPKALFYLHKYINSRFEKGKTEIYTDYFKEQNKIDELYALGIAETIKLLEEYKIQMNKMYENEKSYKKAAERLDSESFIAPSIIEDDYKLLLDEFTKLNEILDWKN